MPFIPIGELVNLRDGDSVSFDRIRGGIITAQELIIAGGTEGVIRSQNFNPSTPVGWAIFGDGSATFGADVTIGGDVISANWDGSNPADLSTVDAGASIGYYLDASVGSMQLEGDFFVEGDITLGGELTGGTITGPLFRTASSGDRLEIDGPGGDAFISIFDASNDLVGFMGWAATGFGSDDLTIATISNLDNLRLEADGAIELKAGGSGADTVVIRATGVGVPATLFSVQNFAGGTEYLRVDDNGHLHVGGDQLFLGSIDGNDYIDMDEGGNYFRLVLDGSEGFRFYHVSATTRIDMYGTGNSHLRKVEGNTLYIDNEGGDKDIYIRTDNGSGMKTRMFFDGSADRISFYDHDGTEKQRFGDSAWFASGVISNPGIGFLSDTNTGIWHSGSTMHFVYNGGSELGLRANICEFPAVGDNTIGSAANVFIGATGSHVMERSTSRLEYKPGWRYANEDKLADLEMPKPIIWRERKSHKGNPDTGVEDYKLDEMMLGFGVEHIHDMLPSAATDRREDGEPDNYDVRSLVAILSAKSKRQDRLIAELFALLEDARLNA